MKPFIIKLAKEAGKILKTGYYKSKTISSKGAQGIVTDTDLKAENKLITMIKKRYPLHNILCEESGKHKETESDYLWIIDPLDGTTNFAHNYIAFCTSIALFYKNKPLYGVVFNPITNELFFAEKGKGATLNNRKIKASNNPLKSALLCTGFAYKRDKSMFKNLNNIGAILYKGAQGIRLDGSAALDLCYVACGKYDCFWESNLSAWDIAAAALIAQEAGAKVTNFKNKQWELHGKEIIASNRRIHKEILKVLSK
jgi:myo-inositol-1(or 4)-monophosphatase